MILELTWKKTLAVLAGLTVSTSIGEPEGTLVTLGSEPVPVIQKCVDASVHVSRRDKTLEFSHPLTWSLDSDGTYVCESAMIQKIHMLEGDVVVQIRLKADGTYSYLKL